VYKLLFSLISLLVMGAATGAEVRDPTRPGTYQSGPAPFKPTTEDAPALSLTGIWISEEARRAIINGSLVTIGDILADGSRVVKIRSRSVLLRHHQRGDKILYLVPAVKHSVK
jgi:hypothetical protein